MNLNSQRCSDRTPPGRRLLSFLTHCPDNESAASLSVWRGGPKMLCFNHFAQNERVTSRQPVTQEKGYQL